KNLCDVRWSHLDLFCRLTWCNGSGCQPRLSKGPSSHLRQRGRFFAAILRRAIRPTRLVPLIRERLSCGPPATVTKIQNCRTVFSGVTVTCWNEFIGRR